MISFDRQHGVALAQYLLERKTSRSEAKQTIAAYNLVSLVRNQQTIAQFAEYRQKRFLELLVLGGHCRLGGLMLEDADLDVAAPKTNQFFKMFPALGNHVQCRTTKERCKTNILLTTAKLLRQIMARRKRSRLSERKCC